MPLVTKCAQCQRPLQVPDSAAGKPVRCPHCQKVFVAAAASRNGPACPACGAALLPGAIACMDCGYMLRSEPVARTEERPNLCTNPACGVANAARDRACQRC